MENFEKETRNRQRSAELIANDPQLAAARPDPAVSNEIEAAGSDVPQRIKTILEKYADRPALGSRDTKLVKNYQTGDVSAELLPSFSTITYRTLSMQVDLIARALAADKVEAGDRVCELGFVSQEYVIVDLALTSRGIVPVPLQKGAQADNLQQVVNETEAVMMFVSLETLTDVSSVIARSHTINKVVVFDYIAEVTDHYTTVQQFREAIAGKVEVETLPDLLKRGLSLPAPPAREITSDICWLVYTSGSTGTPKGAMYTHEHVAGLFSNRTVSSFHSNFHNEPSITINFIPMSHGFGRAIICSTLCKGGTAYFTAKSDMSKLMEDYALVRPTELYLVPRVLDMLHQEYEGRLANELAQGVPESEAIANVSLFLRRKMGNRYFMIISGGAPIAQSVIDWAESTFDCLFHNQYALTEAGGYVMVDKRVLPRILEHRLIDVPELGYFVTDKPFPRGEFLIKPKEKFRGYYKQPETTAKAFDDQGFYRTGDIMAEVAPNQFEYIDRCNNVIKLAQGEFVTLGRLNVVFGNSPLVKQVYVYGDSHRAYLVAVVVPTPEAFESYHAQELKRAILQSLEAVATTYKLSAYEVPRDVLIETTPFSLENRLLLPSLKPAMPQLRIHYKDALEKLYADRNSQRSISLDKLTSYSKKNSVLETIMYAVKIAMDIDSIDLTPQSRFSELGGDSMVALSLAGMLQNVFKIEVPVTVINNPAVDLESIATWIEARKIGTQVCQKGTFEAVHGFQTTTVRASDLKLAKFVDLDDISGQIARNPPRNVLITGSTGFLGRFLLLELLEYVKKLDGTVFCLVRACNDDEAQQRIGKVFSTSDHSLGECYQNVVSHCKAIAGDKGEKKLGLNEATWNKLAHGVDLIVDAAALVHHVASYDQLFTPNVAGTAELIQLALTATIKPYVFLSSAAVGLEMTPETFVENNDIRLANPVREINDCYANGYATSKWASEVLLREAHEAHQLPVQVFRSSLILPHREYAGATNYSDMFTRLVMSLILTKVAPISFYELNNGKPPRSHYDGLPVDFLAASIVDISLKNFFGYATYHTMNHHEDGVGLDQITSWLREAGYSISTINDYSQWLSTFTIRLEALPPSLRQSSALPLLSDYQTPKVPVESSIAPNTQFRKAVSEHTRFQEIPHIDFALIQKCVSDLRSSGLISGIESFCASLPL